MGDSDAHCSVKSTSPGHSSKAPWDIRSCAWRTVGKKVDQRVAQGRHERRKCRWWLPGQGSCFRPVSIEGAGGADQRLWGVMPPEVWNRSQPPRPLLQAPSGGRGRRMDGQLPLAPPPLWAGPTQCPQATVGHSNVRLSLRESPWSECVQRE